MDLLIFANYESQIKISSIIKQQVRTILDRVKVLVEMYVKQNVKEAKQMLTY